MWLLKKLELFGKIDYFFSLLNIPKFLIESFSNSICSSVLPKEKDSDYIDYIEYGGTPHCIFRGNAEQLVVR